jgi:hypothetical protein
LQRCIFPTRPVLDKQADHQFMLSPWKTRLVWFGKGLTHPALWRFLLKWQTRYVLAWLVTLAAAAGALYFAWTGFDNPASGERRDGNSGHVMIDFGGQYLMGRMLVRGYGKQLYYRSYLRQVLTETYPREDESPNQERSDAENMMYWIMGGDDPQAGETLASFLMPLAAANGLETATTLAWGNQEWTEERIETILTPRVGGPLYPPIHSFLYYPLALLPAQTAYRVSQVIGLLLSLLAGLAIYRLSQGRIWWPVATLGILAFPGFAGSMVLAQNATLTVGILLWGWVLIASGRPTWGGIVWGLLAFKPVWALAFFLPPLILGRWRVCLGMIATGLCLIGLTLPAVGFGSWISWLRIGSEAAEAYKADENWIPLSRDLLSIPRRGFNFQETAYYERQTDRAMEIRGWALLIAVAELTVRLVTLRRRSFQAATGPAAAFLLLAAWMSCFHFMYYDVLLAALPVCLLLTEPARYLIPRLIILFPLGRSQTASEDYYKPRPVQTWPPPLPHIAPQRQHVWVLNSMTLTLITALLSTAYVLPLFGVGLRAAPFDTYCLMALWLWCGWLVIREVPGKTDSKTILHAAGPPVLAQERVELSADVGSPH